MVKNEETLRSMGTVGLAYSSGGRWKEAEELHVGVMETRKSVPGEEHQDMLTSMNNFAFTLKSQSRNEEAISLMRRCFRLQKHILRPRHPDIGRQNVSSSIWSIYPLSTGT